MICYGFNELNIKAQIIFIISLAWVSYFSSSYIPALLILPFMFFIFIKEAVSFFLILSCIAISFIDIEFSFIFFFQIYILLFFGVRYSCYRIFFEKIFVLFCLFIFIFIFIFTIPIDGYSWYEILSMKSRFWTFFPILSLEFNPNFLGFLAAISLVFSVSHKKYWIALFLLYILLLTQSRLAFLFLFVTTIFQLKLSGKMIGYILFFIVFMVCILYFSPMGDRLSSMDFSSREYIYPAAISIIEDNFPFGVPKSVFYNFISDYFALDNLYLATILRFGIFGLSFLVLFLLKLITNFKHYTNRDKGMLVAFFLLGLIESSFMTNLLYMLPFSILLYNVKNTKV